MANKKSNADIDIEDMSNDQLRNMDIDELGELLGKQDDSNPEKPIEDTTAEEEEEPQTEEPEEEEAATEEIPKEEEVDISEPELIRGKSRAEIAKMWQDAQAMISKQGNEKHEFKKELQELREQIQKPITEEKKDELMDKLAAYNQEDIEVIRELVRNESQNLTKAQQEAKEKALQSNAESNELFWSHLEKIDPNTSEAIKEDVLKAIAKDKESTLQKKGWLEGYVLNYKASKSVPVKPRVDLTNKKLKAKTAGSGGLPTATKKSVAEMTAEEYAESVGLKRATSY